MSSEPIMLTSAFLPLSIKYSDKAVADTINATLAPIHLPMIAVSQTVLSSDQTDATVTTNNRTLNKCFIRKVRSVNEFHYILGTVPPNLFCLNNQVAFRSI